MVSLAMGCADEVTLRWLDAWLWRLLLGMGPWHSRTQLMTSGRLNRRRRQVLLYRLV